jgi:hypothetical protein
VKVCLHLLLLAAATLLAGANHARATSVVAPSFAELVMQAELIVRARVVGVRAARVESSRGPVIKTYVTLAVEKQLKGTPVPGLTLELLGGELDGEGMRVAGMPRFTEGGVEILFISGNGVRFCPLVAMMHGRYKVLTDAAGSRDYVARNDGVPLESEHDVQLPQSANPLAPQLKRVSAALSAGTFEQRIAAEVSRRAALP